MRVIEFGGNEGVPSPLPLFSSLKESENGKRNKQRPFSSSARIFH
jgi:hypothetical protein